MSMNLHCKEVELWQTPTWVTYLIESDMDGGWKGVLKRYKMWVESHTQGSFESEEALNFKREIVNDHLKQLDHAVKDNRKLHFSIL